MAAIQYDSSEDFTFLGIWIGMLSFFAHGGIYLLASSCCDEKRLSKQGTLKLLDMLLTALVWWLFSYGIAFEGYGLFYGSNSSVSSDFSYVNWFVQWSFLSLSTGIVSSSISSRLSRPAYFLLIFLFSSIIYPWIVHWCWDCGWASPFRASTKDLLLAGCGVLDIGGSGVIYLSAATVITITSTFCRKSNEVVELSECSSIFSHFGTLFSWFGMLGVCHATLLFVTNSNAMLMRSVANIMIAASASCISCTAFMFVEDRDAINIDKSNRSALSGIVAIAACSCTCEVYGAFIIGTVAGIIYISFSKLCRVIDLTDDFEAIPIFLPNSMWGLIAGGLFNVPELYGQLFGFEYSNDSESRAQYCGGLLYTGNGNQLYANLCLLVVIVNTAGFLWFIVSTLLDISTNLKTEAHYEALYNDELNNSSNSFGRGKSKPISRSEFEFQQNMDDNYQDPFYIKNRYLWDMVFILPNQRNVQGIESNRQYNNLDDVSKLWISD